MAKGTFSPAAKVIALLTGYASAAVLANQVLVKAVMPCDGRLGGVQADADTAGTGAGNTVLDVLVDGSSVYAAAGDKPLLAATSTGAFASGRPASKALRVGDEVVMKVLSVSTTGHANLGFTVAIERP